MKIQVLIHKTVEIDTDEEWGGDLSPLYEKLRNMGLTGQVSAPQINHAVGEMIEEDGLEAVLGEETIVDADDVQVSVPNGTVLEIPEDESDEPEEEEEGEEDDGFQRRAEEALTSGKVSPASEEDEETDKKSDVPSRDR